MTASLALYRFGTRLLEPLAPWLVEQRLKVGWQAVDRPGDVEGFLADYGARLRTAYPARPDGSTVFPFRRIFGVVTAPI